MIRAVILPASLVALATPAAADMSQRAGSAAPREPSREGHRSAIEVFPWSDGALYRVYAQPERLTDIALQPGETIVSVAAGDTVRWTVGDTSSGSGEAKRTHLLVKPFSAGLRTNLVVATDRRVYHLELESRGSGAMTALRWTYPQDDLLMLRQAQDAVTARRPIASGLSLEDLHFDYVIRGDKPAWRPLRAFDDGRQTFIEFPPSIAVGEAPPLFLVGAREEAQLVNYRVSGRFYVVDRLFGIAELRLGEKRQQVVRIERAAPTGRRNRGERDD